MNSLDQLIKRLQRIIYDSRISHTARRDIREAIVELKIARQKEKKRKYTGTPVKVSRTAKEKRDE